MSCYSSSSSSSSSSVIIGGGGGATTSINSTRAVDDPTILKHLPFSQYMSPHSRTKLPTPKQLEASHVGGSILHTCNPKFGGEHVSSSTSRGMKMMMIEKDGPTREGQIMNMLYGDGEQSSEHHAVTGSHRLSHALSNVKVRSRSGLPPTHEQNIWQRELWKQFGAKGDPLRKGRSSFNYRNMRSSGRLGAQQQLVYQMKKRQSMQAATAAAAEAAGAGRGGGGEGCGGGYDGGKLLL